MLQDIRDYKGEIPLLYSTSDMEYLILDKDGQVRRAKRAMLGYRKCRKCKAFTKSEVVHYTDGECIHALTVDTTTMSITDRTAERVVTGPTSCLGRIGIDRHDGSSINVNAEVVNGALVLTAKNVKIKLTNDMLKSILT